MFKKEYFKYTLLLVIVGIAIAAMEAHDKGHPYAKYLILGIGISVLIKSIYGALQLQRFTIKDGDKHYPYHALFIGVDQWVYAVPMIGFSIFYLLYREPVFGFFQLITTVSIVTFNIIKNRKGHFNVLFTKDRIVVNENSFNEIPYESIVHIEHKTPTKIFIHTKNSDEAIIMNIDRIHSDYREAFKEELLGLQTNKVMLPDPS